MNISTSAAGNISLLKTLLKAGLFAFVILLFSTPEISAQEYPDSKGKDFWLTFLPNYHLSKKSDDPRLRLGDSLYIFIAATESTNGKITYRNRFGKEFSQNISIPDPKNIYVFKVSFYDFELLGLNDSEEPSDGGESGIVSNVSFHVEMNKDVTVYALNQAVWTSDAFLVLPTDAVGNDYIIMAYNSDEDTPSEFAVVATEDGTEITISPTVDVFRLPEYPVVRTLNKGEVFLVQADVERDPRSDLTGTEIKATKPVAVFSGQQRATVPIYHNFGSNKSRDHIIEQMPPVNTWGKSAYLIPYPVPRDIENGENNAPDSYRVLFGYDTTTLTINGSLVGTFNRGDFYEAPLTTASVVKTSAAALIAQFKKTSDVPGGGSASKLSDPFMMMIPPSEQFLNSYRFINAQAYQYEAYIDAFGNERIRYGKVYLEQYISVVVPKIALSSVRLDGNAVQTGIFKDVPQSLYSYATIPVSDGVHTIEADSTLGLYVFGYGFANSYGYIGGMSFRPIDFEKPKIISAIDCFEVRGGVYDTLLNDSRLASVTFPDALKTNVDITVLKSTPDSLRFSARLSDKYQDGRFAIFGEDYSELVGRDTIDIPGFTISSQFVKSNNEIDGIDEEIAENKERCYTIRLNNYGKFPHTITKLEFLKKTAEYVLQSSAPITLQPGQSKEINVCFKSPSGEFSDTLVIGDACADRNIMALKLLVVKDTKAPVLLKESTPCGDKHTLNITEVLKSDAGIQSVEIFEAVNFTFTSELNFPNTARLTGVLTDPLKDGFYAIRTMDSVGNITEHRDTIQGFTISFPTISSSGAAISYVDNPIGFFSCDSIEISNYGTMPFVFDNVYALENIYFSLPQSQFPITLQPGESRRIQVCYRPLEATDGEFRDTLIFTHNCLLKRIPLRGTSLASIYSGDARCDVKLRLTTEKILGTFILEQNIPNPVQEETSVIFGLTDPAQVKITLYDSRGMLVSTLLDEKRNAGTYELQFVPKDIPNGIYMYELQSGVTRISRTMVIAR
ncbi:MAG: T9SS type A sorting domain-containing protein [Bacteroidota bacterium]